MADIIRKGDSIYPKNVKKGNPDPGMTIRQVPRGSIGEGQINYKDRPYSDNHMHGSNKYLKY